MIEIATIKVDYQNPDHAQDLITLLDQYAQDPMGGGNPLSDYAKENLISGLQNTSNAVSFLLYVDNKPAALANCFSGFSTFKAKPLLNIHDFVVLSQYRGMSLSQTLLSEIVDYAKSQQCCKITLEVLEGNTTARNAYQKFGFDDYQLDPASGKALFWEYPIN